MSKTKLLQACLLLLFILTQNGTLHAQSNVLNRLDSLEAALSNADDDSARFNLLLDISDLNTRVNADKGLKYGKEALQLAKKMEMQEGIAASYNIIGDNYRAKSDMGKAFEYYTNALEVNSRTDNKRLRSIILTNIMHVYMDQRKLDKAEDFGKRALQLAEEMGARDRLALINTDMGVLMWHRGNYRTMLDYFQRSLKIHRELDDKINIGIALNNIAASYAVLEDYHTGLKYAKEALAISESIGDKYNIAGCLGNIGELHLNLGNYRQAVEHYNRAIAVNSEVGNIQGLSNHYGMLTQVYSKMGDYKAALEAKNKELLYNDSLMKKANSEQITRLELNSQYEKKQLADSLKNAEAKRLAAVRLQKQRVFTFSGIGLAIVLTAFSVFIARERKKSDKLLLNILPAEVAKELKRKGEADAQLFDDVSVLFTDFVGFTKVSELLTPQELVDELDNCFKAFDEITGKHGIEKIKTIGDAYLAVCGLPTADPQHAGKTVAAAKEIVAYMQQRRAQLGDKTFEIRIGIHSGEVVAGIVGIKKFAYDIWGDTVNTAARMESNSEPGKINISQTTYELVKDSYTCTYRGELEAKNKGMMKMYFVEG